MGHLLGHRCLEIPVDKEMVGPRRSPIEKYKSRTNINYRKDQLVPSLTAEFMYQFQLKKKKEDESYFIHRTRDRSSECCTSELFHCTSPLSSAKLNERHDLHKSS